MRTAIKTLLLLLLLGVFACVSRAQQIDDYTGEEDEQFATQGDVRFLSEPHCLLTARLSRLKQRKMIQKKFLPKRTSQHLPLRKINPREMQRRR